MKKIESEYGNTKFILHDDNSIELYFVSDQMLYVKEFYTKNRFPNPKETFQYLSDNIRSIEIDLITAPIEENVLYPDIYQIDFFNVVQMHYSRGIIYDEDYNGINIEATKYKVFKPIVNHDDDILEINKYMLLEVLLEYNIKYLYNIESRTIKAGDIIFYHFSIRGVKGLKK